MTKSLTGLKSGLGFAPIPSLCLGLMLIGFTPAAAQEVSQQQADAILKELQQIRQLLERMERANRSRPARTPVNPAIVKLPIGDGFSIGSESAPLTLIEFTDYQCLYCRRFHLEAFKHLKEKYIDTGKVRFVSRDLPLAFHKNALPAAHAARCAEDQGKYWEMRHVLITNANKLGRDDILEYAANLSLDVSTFQSCVDTEKYADAIQTDITTANSAGITGTPTFVLGKTSEDFRGVKLVGAQPFKMLEARIKELLAEN